MHVPAHFTAASLVNAAGLISHPQNENVREAHDALLTGAEKIRQLEARVEALELGLANARLRLTLVINRDQHKLLDVVVRDEAAALLAPQA